MWGGDSLGRSALVTPREWADANAFDSSEQRRRALPRRAEDDLR